MRVGGHAMRLHAAKLAQRLQRPFNVRRQIRTDERILGGCCWYDTTASGPSLVSDSCAGRPYSVRFVQRFTRRAKIRNT